MASPIYPSPWKILLTLTAACVISALVWFFGPTIQIGSAVPLASNMSRYLVAGGLLALWAIVTLFSVMSGRNRPGYSHRKSAPHDSHPGSVQQLNPVSSKSEPDSIPAADSVRLVNFGFYGRGLTQAETADEKNGQVAHYNLPTAFVTGWQDWLSALMDQGASGYQEKWPALFQQSPAYRFALSAGIAGDLGWAGIMLPTPALDDKQFPLCFAATLPAGISAAEALYRLDTWYTALEKMVQRVSQAGYDIGELQKETQQFATSAACTVAIPSPPAATFNIGTSGIEGSVSVRASAANALQAGADQLPLVNALLTQTLYQYSVWATSHNGASSASDCVIASGLPTGTQGLALFSRDWAGSGCGNLLLTGTQDSQTELETPRFAAATLENDPQTSVTTSVTTSTQASEQTPQDDDITMLKRPGPVGGGTQKKTE